MFHRIRRGVVGASGWAPPARALHPVSPDVIVVAAVDTIVFSDEAMSVLERIAAANDSIMFSDSAVGGVGTAAEAADTIEFTDSAVGEALALFAIAEDSLSLSDSAESITQRIATGSDTITFSDSAVAVGGGADLYPWDQSFDMNEVDFHVAAGAWGPQYPIQVAEGPDAPTTFATVTTRAEFQTALNVPFSEITIGVAELDCLGTGLTGTISHVRVIVPPGSLLKSPHFSGTIDHLMLSGETVGQATGGQVHNLFVSGAWDHLVIDYLDMSGPGLVGDPPDASQAFDVRGGSRLAITGCRGMAGCEFALSRASNATIVNSSVQTANLMPEPVADESWFWRDTPFVTGATVIWGCDLRVPTSGRTNVFHRYRRHPDGTTGLVWIGRNIMCDLIEARFLWINAAAGGGSGTLAGFFTYRNKVYGHQVTSGRAWSSDDSRYVQHKENEFYGDAFTSDAILTALTNNAVNGLVLDGNQYFDTSNPAPTLPPWGARGNPTGVPWDIGP